MKQGMSIKRLLLFITFYIVSLCINALGLDIYCSPQIISGAEIYLLSDSPEVAFYNPAHSGDGVSVNHSNPFGMTELNIFQLASQFTIKSEVFSLGTISMDNKYISDRVYYLGYSKQIYDLSLGISGRYYSQKIDEYKRLDAVTGVVGAIWSVNNISHGLSFSNMTHTTKEQIELPSAFKYECMVFVFENTRFAVALEKEKSFDMRYSFGANHRVFDLLSLSTGFITNPGQFSAGCSVSIDNFTVNYGMRTHQELGYTQAVGVLFRF